MTTRCILQMALLLCFSTTALFRSYNLLQFQQRRSAMACQKLLKQLSGNPESCLDDRMNFQVPEEINQPRQFQKEDTALIIYEMLHQIFGIFRRNFSSTGWNETVIENLRAELYQQMDRLDTILEEYMEEDNSTWGNVKTLVHLKKYYSRIIQYLKAKDYSSCAWTIVRMETLINFSIIRSLIDYL
ncbi:interferon beta [Orycteropus afer afer]|uniref:Interferon beta n=1 Tax=Orycteropus afer afer TaxID=1230840 RepID=A0A8B7ARZ8_ORYAF|nr:interferon beta [Orycteropus afer afer]